jgi:hypothetical protein
MMQDYPKALPADAKVGFTVVNQVRTCIDQKRMGRKFTGLPIALPADANVGLAQIVKKKRSAR